MECLAHNEIVNNLRQILNGGSQFNGLTPVNMGTLGKKNICLDHGKSVGIYKSCAFSIDLRAEMVCLSTSRLTEFFIKGDVDNFYWLGKSNYVIHPKSDMIINIRTGKPVKNNNGMIQVCNDDGKRCAYTVRYIYETLRNHLNTLKL